MPKHLHLAELERLERIERLDAEEAEAEREREEVRAEREGRSWLTENSGCHLSETEKDWHPENG